jgi:hypothetical protein
MIDQTLRHAIERQEALRREAAHQRRARRQPAASRGIVATVATFLRGIFASPIPTGTILPATH